MSAGLARRSSRSRVAVASASAVHVGQLAGGGMEALPQAGEHLHAVERPAARSRPRRAALEPARSVASCPRPRAGESATRCVLGREPAPGESGSGGRLPRVGAGRRATSGRRPRVALSRRRGRPTGVCAVSSRRLASASSSRPWRRSWSHAICDPPMVLGERLRRQGSGRSARRSPIACRRGSPRQISAKAPLDPRLRTVVGGDRVRHPLALDQPHVPPVRGHDQAVRLDDVDREEPPERPCSRLPHRATASRAPSPGGAGVLVGRGCGVEDQPAAFWRGRQRELFGGEPVADQRQQVTSGAERLARRGRAARRRRTSARVRRS